MTMNYYSACDGLMLYEDADDVSKNYHWIPQHDNTNQFWLMGDPTVGGEKLNDKIRRVVEMPEVAHSFRRLKSNDNIGVVFYEGENFTGRQHIHEKGNFELEPYGQLIVYKSMVVAPNCSVSFGFNASRSGQAGYHPKEYIALAQGPIQVQCNDNANNLCGTAYFHNTSFWSGHGLPILDIDQGVNLTSLGNGHWDNEISRFEASQGNTTCKGVAFYEDNGNASEEKPRRYIPAGDGSNTTFTSTLNNKISYLKPGECCGTLDAEDKASFLRGFNETIKTTSYWNTLKDDAAKTGRSFLSAGIDFGCTYLVNGPGKVAIYGYGLMRGCDVKTNLEHLKTALTTYGSNNNVDVTRFNELLTAIGNNAGFSESSSTLKIMGGLFANFLLDVIINHQNYTVAAARSAGCLATFLGLKAAIPRLQTWCEVWAQALGPVPEQKSFLEIQDGIDANIKIHEEL